MWRIYDELIAAVPADLTIDDCLIGQNWILVRSAGVGVAMAQSEAGGRPVHSVSPVGLKARDVAAWVKSWNYPEAAIGLAAINSALNTPADVERRWDVRLAEMPGQDLFRHVEPTLRGKKVAVVGHFYGVERLAEICALSVLERRPMEGDLPDPACEYILGHQDVVILTATTLINKTMPRLLQLGRGAQVMVCGPSTPLHPLLLAHGVHQLGGLVVEDEAQAWRTVQEGAERELLSRGSRMINISADHLATSDAGLGQ